MSFPSRRIASGSDFTSIASKSAIISTRARIFGGGRKAPGWLKIRRPSPLEGLPFPNVNDPANPILHEVDPRPVGQPPHLLLERKWNRSEEPSLVKERR